MNYFIAERSCLHHLDWVHLFDFWIRPAILLALARRVCPVAESCHPGHVSWIDLRGCYLSSIRHRQEKTLFRYFYDTFYCMFKGMNRLDKSWVWLLEDLMPFAEALTPEGCLRHITSHVYYNRKNSNPADSGVRSMISVVYTALWPHKLLERMLLLWSTVSKSLGLTWVLIARGHLRIETRYTDRLGIL